MPSEFTKTFEMHFAIIFINVVNKRPINLASFNKIGIRNRNSGNFKTIRYVDWATATS